jgi:hypothetical protein
MTRAQEHGGVTYQGEHMDYVVGQLETLQAQ